MKDHITPVAACAPSRRGLIKAASSAGVALALGLPSLKAASAQTPQAELMEELVIDLAGAPESIDPAFAYSARDWSIVHSIYDSPLGYAADGSIQPLAAESFSAIDDVTWEITLRSDLQFHDGSAVTSAAITRSVAYLAASESEASGLFAGIVDVVEVDDLAARIVTDSPSPWLPAQIAVWLLLLPEGHSLDTALTAPVGSGPYRFDSQEPGSSLTLTRNPDYIWGSPKGELLADRVVYRFVPEAATRIADLATGAAHLITEIPASQLETVTDSGALAIETGVVGSAFIRIASDVAPFDNPLVRQALNFAIDVEAIGQALVSPATARLASLFPDDRSMAFNPDLEPYAYDPEAARRLLEEAGVGDGFEAELEITSGASVEVAEAIAAQLGEIGVAVSIVVSEYTDFNATWNDAAAPALRMATWSPLYDPHTLLGLVFDGEGFLSRYANPEVNALIEQAGTEIDVVARASLYRDLAALMYQDAPAVFLWNLVAGYGVAESTAAWRPRGDEYVLATSVEGPA